jgi:hypothetical protein
MAGPGIPNIAYELDERHERATLTIGTQRVEADAVELERLVQFLGMLRSAMTPAVEADVPSTPFLQIESPRLAVRLTQDQTGAGLVVRTAPYGWIGFNLDRTQAADLGRHLTELAARMKAPAAKG